MRLPSLPSLSGPPQQARRAPSTGGHREEKGRCPARQESSLMGRPALSPEEAQPRPGQLCVLSLLTRGQGLNQPALTLRKPSGPEG